jgi:formamidopyrimidine-DNA glycosylase
MPELPDVTVYVERLTALCAGHVLQRVRLGGPALLRSVDPPLSAAHGRTVRGARRIGKRIALELEGELFLVVHLMIAGRFRWRDPGAAIPKKVGHAAFDFDHGTLLLTEASSKKRATLHVVQGEANLAAHDPGGLEVFECDLAAFSERLRLENRTLKRALTDPRILSGIGNAYSDEILHRARLSPVKLTQKLDDAELARLFDATRETLGLWIRRLSDEVGEGFPEKVTAFRPEMAVHGRHQLPCPDCGAPVQRIVHAENESNYCAECQTGGRLLADRALSQLLKKDWPRTLEELEARMRDG